jgi:hypothetical protein
MSQLSPTNWYIYYTRPRQLARVITRYFTNRLIASLLHRYLCCEHPITIVELGGGCSSFYQPLTKLLDYKNYVAVDNNQLGLDITASRVATDSRLVLINHDIIQPISDRSILGDLVFSVGLIEHFPVNLTERAIAAHFEWLAPRGLVVITYPIPTWLYLLSRRLYERMGWWIFPDETPLKLDRVEQLLRAYGQILEHRINWLTPFTQAVVVVRSYH